MANALGLYERGRRGAGEGLATLAAIGGGRPSPEYRAILEQILDEEWTSSWSPR
jgi:hypothetical protein